MKKTFYTVHLEEKHPSDLSSSLDELIGNKRKRYDFIN